MSKKVKVTMKRRHHLYVEENGMANLLNYMAHFSPGRSTFLGFMRVDGHHEGILIGHKEEDKEMFMGVHLMHDPHPNIFTESVHREQKDLDAGRRTLVVFLGTDNTSYCRRFGNQEEALNWVYNTPFIDPEDPRNLYWNS